MQKQETNGAKETLIYYFFGEDIGPEYKDTFRGFNTAEEYVDNLLGRLWDEGYKVVKI